MVPLHIQSQCEHLAALRPVQGLEAWRPAFLQILPLMVPYPQGRQR